MSFNKLLDLYKRLTVNGLYDDVGEDDLRRIRTINSVSIILLAALVLFMVIDGLFFRRVYVVMVEAMAFVTGAYYLYIQRKIRDINLISHFATAIITFSMFGISLLSGVGTSTAFWFFFIPPFAFYVNGARGGLIWSFVNFAWLLLHMILGVFHIYGIPVGWDFAVNLLLAFLVVVILAYLFERSRAAAVNNLASANDEMRRLIYVVSHDLRTPLTALRGYSEFLREDIDANNTEDIRTDIDRIDLMAKNLGSMIDDLLNLSRIGRQVSEDEMVNTREVIDLVVAGNEPQLLEKKIKVDIVEPLPRLYMNRRKFEEILRNLMSNAIKYIGDAKEPLIRIGAYDRDDEYHFYVKDNGIGIDKKDFDEIFKLFVRKTDMGEGSGIGLSIVKGFVEDMGGRVWVESELGKGSTFWFSVPKKEPPKEGEQ